LLEATQGCDVDIKAVLQQSKEAADKRKTLPLSLVSLHLGKNLGVQSFQY
jgi:hypothetical protein